MLVRGAARQRRSGARRRRAPRVLQRQRRVLENPLGAEHRSVAHAVSHAGHLQGDARQREDRSAARRVDRHVARFAPVQPRRAEARERAQGHHLHRERVAQRSADRAGAIRRSCASGATPKSRSSSPGQQAVLGYGILGHEWNEDLDNGFRPAGLMRMSTTTVNNVPYIQDFGTVYAAGTATHHLTLFRAPSGALVFSAGTVQWAWGLDPNHDTETGIPPERANGSNIRVGVDLKGAVRAIQQATLNLLADMGVQPTTRAARPRRARRRRPTGTPPISRVDGGARDRSATARSRSPASRQTPAASSPASKCRWTAARRWHPADGTARWRYRFEAAAAPATGAILSRAVDDSGTSKATIKEDGADARRRHQPQSHTREPQKLNASHVGRLSSRPVSHAWKADASAHRAEASLAFPAVLLLGAAAARRRRAARCRHLQRALGPLCPLCPLWWYKPVDADLQVIAS